MDRPYLVYVGGDSEQEIKCLYLGTDGYKAQTAFNDAGQDGSNSIVRFCQFPEHSQIRTPMRDGVPPKAKPVPAAKGGKKPQEKTPHATTAPETASEQSQAAGTEADGDDEEDTGI